MFGRFVSEDPFDFAGGQADLYGYVGDGPTEFVDPSGHELIAAAVLGIGAGFGALNEGLQAYACGARGLNLAKAIGRGMAAGTSKAEGAATEIGKALSPGLAVGETLKAIAGCSQ